MTPTLALYRSRHVIDPVLAEYGPPQAVIGRLVCARDADLRGRYVTGYEVIAAGGTANGYAFALRPEYRP